MKVEEIKKLKSGKYKVLIDGEEFITYDDVILKNHLLFHKTISDDEFEQMMKDNIYYDAYHKSLKFIFKRIV